MRIMHDKSSKILIVEISILTFESDEMARRRPFVRFDIKKQIELFACITSSVIYFSKEAQ